MTTNVSYYSKIEKFIVCYKNTPTCYLTCKWHKLVFVTFMTKPARSWVIPCILLSIKRRLSNIFTSSIKCFQIRSCVSWKWNKPSFCHACDKTCFLSFQNGAFANILNPVSQLWRRILRLQNLETNYSQWSADTMSQLSDQSLFFICLSKQSFFSKIVIFIFESKKTKHHSGDFRSEYDQTLPWMKMCFSFSFFIRFL